MKRFLVISLISSFVAAGCGGGGGGDDGSADGDAGSAVGMYTGTTANGNALEGVVLDNGTYWFVYTEAGGSTFGGVLQGTGNLQGSAFNSSNGKDFSLEDEEIYDVTLNANSIAETSLDGTLGYPGGTTVSFTSDYDADYEQTPSLATLAGTYFGFIESSAGEFSATATISASGAVSGSSTTGCNISGTASVHASGNVYDVSISFGGGTCAQGTATFNGIAYFGNDGRLYALTHNDSRSDGLLFVGTTDA